MTQRKVTVKLRNEELSGWDVPVEESLGRATEFILEDGAVLRVKVVVTSVVRVDGKTDDEGNPVYVMQVTNNISLVTPPTKLGSQRIQ